MTFCIQSWLRCLTNSVWRVLLPLVCVCLVCPPSFSSPSAEKRMLCQDISLSPQMQDQVLTSLQTGPIPCVDRASDKDGLPHFTLSSSLFSLAFLKRIRLPGTPLFLPHPSDIRGMLPLALAPPSSIIA